MLHVPDLMGMKKKTPRPKPAGALQMLVLLLVQMLVQIVSYRVDLPPLDAVQQIPRGAEGVETRGRGTDRGPTGLCTATGRSCSILLS